MTGTLEHVNSASTFTHPIIVLCAAKSPTSVSCRLLLLLYSPVMLMLLMLLLLSLLVLVAVVDAAA